MAIFARRNSDRQARRNRTRTVISAGERLEDRALLSTQTMSLAVGGHSSLPFVDASGSAYTLKLTGSPSTAGGVTDYGQVLVQFKTVGGKNYLNSVQILDSPSPNFTLNFTSAAGPGHSVALPAITASGAKPYGGIVTNGPGVNFMMTGYSGPELLGPNGSINVGEVTGPVTVALSAGQALRAGNIDAGASLTVVPATPGANITGSVIVGAVNGALTVNGPLGPSARVVVAGESANGSMTFNGNVNAGAVIASNGDLAGTYSAAYPNAGLTINGSLGGTVTVVGNVAKASINGDDLAGSVVAASGNLTTYINGGNDWGLIKGANVVLKVDSTGATYTAGSAMSHQAARPAVAAGTTNEDETYGGNVYSGATIVSTGTQMLFTNGGFNGSDQSVGALTATIGNSTSIGSNDVGPRALFWGNGAESISVPNGSFNGTEIADNMTLNVGQDVGATASLVSTGTQTLNVTGDFNGLDRANALTATIGGTVGDGASIVANTVNGFSVGGDYDGSLTVISTFDPLFAATAAPMGTTLNKVTLIGGDLNGDISIPAPTDPAISQLVFGGSLNGNLLIGGALNSDLFITNDLTGGLTLHGDVGTAAANNTIHVGGNFTAAGSVQTPDPYTTDTSGDAYDGDSTFQDQDGNTIGNMTIVGPVRDGHINVTV